MAKGAWMQPVEWLAEAGGLTLLPSHAHLIAKSALACFLLQLVLSPALSSLVPSYTSLKAKTRRDWNIRAVETEFIQAFVHAIYASIAATWLISKPEVWNAINSDKTFGHNAEVAWVVSLSTGYFVWDTMVSLALLRSQGPGFLIHAVACLGVFLCGHRPVFQYFGCVFLLWEYSSIFLNVHWALDKLNLTGSTYQFINGIILLVTFFGVRIIYGNVVAWKFWKESVRSDVRATLPWWIPAAHQLAMASLTGSVLNAYWFRQMIFAIKKRFDGSDKSTKRQT